MTDTFPEWAFAPFDACRKRLLDGGRLLLTSELGLAALEHLMKGKLVDSETQMPHSIELRKAAEKENVEPRRELLLLSANAVVSFWSALEVGIEDFLIAWMMNHSDALNVPAIGKIKITLAQFEALDREERIRMLLSELERSVIGKQGVDCFEPLLETFDLSGPVEKEIKATIYEMQHVRNVVVHRGRNRMKDWRAAVRIWETNGVGHHGLTATPSKQEQRTQKNRATIVEAILETQDGELNESSHEIPRFQNKGVDDSKRNRQMQRLLELRAANRE